MLFSKTKKIAAVSVFIILFAPSISQAASCKFSWYPFNQTDQIKQTSECFVLTETAQTCEQFLAADQAKPQMGTLVTAPSYRQINPPSDWGAVKIDTASFPDNFCTPLPSDQSEVQLSELEAELSARKPIPRINIPGLNFSNVLSTTENGDTYFYIPWIPELIAALYKFGIAIVSIVAVVVIIIQGMRIVTSGGGEAKQGAYKKILQSVIGLFIAWGSFAILYNINPALVQFNALRVQVVQGEPPIQESEAISENNYPTITNVQKPTWNAETFDCSKKTSYQPAGVVSPADIISYSCPGLVGKKVSTIKEMKEPLCRVGQLAITQGYTIEIKDSYRDFNGQVNNWCGSGARNYPKWQERKAFNATPGYSNHGHGRAVDAVLQKNGKALFGATSKKQCGVNPEYVAKIASLFYAADINFVRLETEIWHFEYGTAGQSARSRTTGPGSKCK